MHGANLKGVAFIATHPKELNHFVLHRLLKRARGLSADQFLFLTTSELSNQLIKDQGIKVLVPLGEGALRRVVGEVDIMRWRGRVVPHQMGIWSIPTFQPSKLLHQRSETDSDAMRNAPRFHGTWMRDVLKAVEVAQKGFVRREGKYLLDPSSAEFAIWADECLAKARLLSTDVETSYKQKQTDESEQASVDEDGKLLRISFSWEPYTGVSIPWSAAYLPTVAKLLASPITKVVWNGVSFDIPLLQANGFVVGGEWWEAMDAAHLYESDLPKGLEWVTADCTDLLPWKHLNLAEPALYSAIDADAALRNMLELEAALIRRGQWEAFRHHSVELMPTLTLAGNRGSRVDLVKQAELREKLSAYRAELLIQAQVMVPRELKPRQIFKRWADDIGDHDVVVVPADIKTCSVCNQPASNKSDHLKGTVGPLNAKGKPTRIPNPCKVAKAEIILVPGFVNEYHEVLDFNPNSTHQLQAYIHHWGHPVGKDKKTKKDSCDSKHIEKLIARYGEKHPIYKLALEFHKLSKVIGTYLPEPDERGYIKTEFTNSPSTWRLGSRKVKNGTQIQNWGSREDSNRWAVEAKRTIIASPGCTLMEIDSSSVEAVMLGWFMGDMQYIELASQGVHAWVTCQRLGWQFNPETAARVKTEHKGLYNQMKVSVHGTNYGMSPYALWQTYPALFASKEDAEQVQGLIFHLIPKLKAYQHNVRWRAQKEGYLETPWHIRHYFYDVFTINADGDIKDGKDAKRVVAFEPQSSNGTFQRDNIRMVAQTKFGDYLPAIANVHDSMGLDCPNELVEEAKETLLDIFTRPIPELAGLMVGAEVSCGQNWGSYDKDTNPEGMKSVAKRAMTNKNLWPQAA